MEERQVGARPHAEECGRARLLGVERLQQPRRSMARGTVLGRLGWKIGEVAEITAETPKVSSIAIGVPDWPGHLAGQHVDVRLTAEDGYQAQRSYSIASAPEDRRVTITVERLDDGEVSPYLVGELGAKDKIELRGPIGGFFVWRAPGDRPLLLIAGGSGVAPLRAIARRCACSIRREPSRTSSIARSSSAWPPRTPRWTLGMR